MPNADETTPPDTQLRVSIPQIVATLPFFLLGAIWCLLFWRMPEKVQEAMARSSASGWETVVGDPLFAESLWRSTTLPLTGIGFLAIGCGILRRSTLLVSLGTVWAITVFVLGWYLLR